MVERALVCGAGGFIGSHLVKRLKKDGFWVRGVDLKFPLYSESQADEFLIGDLRNQEFCRIAVSHRFDEVYQLAADMGGAGYTFTGDHDAYQMHNSATINLNILDLCHRMGIGSIFYSSSACMYPGHNLQDPQNPNCSEDSAYPANPECEYGWEKLFSERLYLAYRRNYGMNTFVARFHSVFGPEESWDNGREKVPPAICRKIARAKDGDSIEVWGDGEQTRSFIYVDECIE
jgi:nucleoside-diphosphate-sugar epimerase